MNKIIINFTPNGFAHPPGTSPHIPYNIHDIYNQIFEAYKIGITMVHMHVWEDKKPSNDPNLYADLIRLIRREMPDLIICVSTSGRYNNNIISRSAVLDLKNELKPDMASLTLGSFNFSNTISYNPPNDIVYLANKMKENGILPEIEIFDNGNVNYFKYLKKKGILGPNNYINLILGNISTAQARVGDLGFLLSQFDDDDDMISIGAFGRHQLPFNSLAIALGHGVRVGLEDNIYLDEKSTVYATNIDLIKRIHKIIDANGKAFMSSIEFCHFFNL